MTDGPIFKTDDGNFVRFSWGTARNDAASRTAGRPIFDKVLLASVTSPGMPKGEMVHEIERHFHDGTIRIRDDLVARFGRPLAAFRSGEVAPELAGTPLDAWPALEITQVAALRALNIHTVEALAELSDTGLQAVGMGARELQARARAFLEAAWGNAPTERLAAENLALRSEIERLGAQIEELAKLAEATPRRGRPRKAAEG